MRLNFFFLIFIFSTTVPFFTSCNNNATITNNQTDNYSLDKQPAKTIIDFLKWYRINQDIQGGLVNNADGKTLDSTKFFSVNFEGTEKYLSQLKSTGFISEKYLDKWREYFKKCEDDFKKNRYNEPPIEGFDYDFIMLSQEFDEDLKNVEKSKIVSQSILNDNAIIKIYFPNGNKLIYKLTKHADKWIIDDIARGFE